MTAMPPLRDILNNTPADAINVDFNFNTIEAHIGSELINRDGSVAMTGPLSLPGAPTAAQHAATKAYVDSQVIPIGTIWEYAGQIAPAGWVFCDGASKSTTDPLYAALFSQIGYIYGGAGANFNLPDRRGRVGVGRYQGDALFGTLGARGGSRDLIVVSHGHTASVNLNSGSVSADHTHSLSGHQHYVEHQHDLQNHAHSGATDAQGAHNHDVGGGLIWALFGAGTLGMDTSGTGHTGTPSNLGALSTQPAHAHNFNTGGPNTNITGYMTARSWSDGPNVGSTGGISANHYHNVNGGVTVDAQGASGANGNLPPYEVTNFIIRIG
jgi:microcystin-dependent protein